MSNHVILIQKLQSFFKVEAHRAGSTVLQMILPRCRNELRAIGANGAEPEELVTASCAFESKSPQMIAHT
jgi:hypothetical protein